MEQKKKPKPFSSEDVLDELDVLFEVPVKVSVLDMILDLAEEWGLVVKKDE